MREPGRRPPRYLRGQETAHGDRPAQSECCRTQGACRESLLSCDNGDGEPTEIGMEDPERAAKFLADTEKQYAGVGRFAVKCEHVVEGMQRIIIQLLMTRGLRDGELAYATVSDLTADPMLRIFRAALMEAMKYLPEVIDEPIVDNVWKRIRKLIETRNDIVHRTWYSGWQTDAGEAVDPIPGGKFKNTNKGNEYRGLQFSVADFHQHADEADELSQILLRMLGCIGIARSFKKNVIVDDAGVVRVPPGTARNPF